MAQADTRFRARRPRRCRHPDRAVPPAGTELQDWIHRGRQETDVFVVALSPEDMSQHLEERWLEETLAEFGLTDVGFPA